LDITGGIVLRFDLPQVPANVIRLEALFNTTTCMLALLVSAWFMLIPAVQGLVKGLLGHGKCPMHLALKTILTARGWQGRLENAGPKMFAAKLLAAASIVALVLYFAGSALWKVPVIVLVVFSCLEWSLSFCAACWAYGLWYRHTSANGQ
jgi:hypothetical protein